MRLSFGAYVEAWVLEGCTFDEIFHESSRDADLVFFGLAEPGENFSAYYNQIQERLKGLSTTVLVLAAEEISFGDVLLNQNAFQEN